MKINSEIQDSIKRETDVNYREASEMLVENEKKAEIAKGEIQRDMASQKTNLKLRLAQRKKQMELKKSGLFEDDEGVNSMLKRMPMSTRANSFLPKFGFGASSSIEDSAYQPNAADNNKNNGHLNFNRQSSSGLRRRAPVSTRASDTIGKVYFPGEVENDHSESINDISGIV